MVAYVTAGCNITIGSYKTYRAKKTVYGSCVRVKFAGNKASRDSAFVLFYLADYRKPDIKFILWVRVNKRDPRQLKWIKGFEDRKQQYIMTRPDLPPMFGANGVIFNYRGLAASMVDYDKFVKYNHK